MENYFEKLTALQNEVGYVKGTINNVALLGLFGEAGEVLNECTCNNEKILTHAVKIAEDVDNLKKAIRDKLMPSPEIIIENEDLFDKEMADVLYYLNALAINRGKTLNDYAQISFDKVMHYKQQKDVRHANISHGAKTE